ncbi:host-nuclease inhibitor Gam family protein [Tissierella carlieri]|uniref:Host-nuclease inhibitor Gam family protein n=1 Tax=Tissierella carlieri TaxID=689904 RepID=A0ABT1SCB0_9FIRM|nr:host-nuclease inhibitor Gam family protein [Tissierella carlieri]MCQ4924106.1 host-nuclease inhibitor Gam family protein [Tissierella carlieri]
MARTKIKEAPVLKTWDDVDAALKEIAEKEIAIEEIEGDMNKQINGIKIASGLEAKPLQDRIDKLGKDIKEFVTEHKEELDGKTKTMNFGKTGFRLSTTLSLPTAKDKLEKIITKLRKRKMDDCIIVKESVNKDVLKKYEEDTIVEIGGTLKKVDTFWYETEREKIRSLRP